MNCDRVGKMISVEEALETVLSVAKRLPPVMLPIHESLGKILAQDVTARDPLPPYRASIKIRDSNRAMLLAAAMHCKVLDLV